MKPISFEFWVKLSDDLVNSKHYRDHIFAIMQGRAMMHFGSRGAIAPDLSKNLASYKKAKSLSPE
ncbi:MAG: hypothetical protein AAGD25_00705 [Cyanobacteria bacterium P01_F01_bin.150]